MTKGALLDQWRRDAAAPFEGWDFSYLAGRMTEAAPPWDYLALARAAVVGAQDILDMATGGGEIFSSLAPFPGRATAVEGFAPNVAVARRRLAPLGVPVFEANTASGMPFERETFDLVLNRHGGFRASEVGRILMPGGVFLTQQVGGDNLADLVGEFDRDLAYPDNSLTRVSEDLTAMGFEIRRAEAWRGPVTFGDVGALIYFLKAIPWVVPGFEVDRHLSVLGRLYDRAESGETLQFTFARFLIAAVKL